LEIVKEVGVDGTAGEEDEMAKMMGFGGFGGSKKR
jgi:hypothetical protein